MAIQIGSDGLLQLVVGGRLLKPQAEVVLQVLVELVTWKQQTYKNSSKQTSTSQNLLVSLLFTCCQFTKSKFVKGHDISIVQMLPETRRTQGRPCLSSLIEKQRNKGPCSLHAYLFSVNTHI